MATTDAVFEHGLADARSQEFYDTTRFWQWMRFPGDVVFALGALFMTWEFMVKLRPLFPLHRPDVSRKTRLAGVTGN